MKRKRREGAVTWCGRRGAGGRNRGDLGGGGGDGRGHGGEEEALELPVGHGGLHELLPGAGDHRHALGG